MNDMEYLSLKTILQFRKSTVNWQGKCLFDIVGISDFAKKAFSGALKTTYLDLLSATANH